VPGVSPALGPYGHGKGLQNRRSPDLGSTGTAHRCVRWSIRQPGLVLRGRRIGCRGVSPPLFTPPDPGAHRRPAKRRG
jgi:hypothetical protein